MKYNVPARLTVGLIMAVLSSVVSQSDAFAEPGIEGRVLVRDFMPRGCAERIPCGPYPRIHPGGEAEVVAMTRSGRVVSTARATPNGNFFLRLRRGRYILSVPSLGIVREVRVGRSLVTGVKLHADVY